MKKKKEDEKSENSWEDMHDSNSENQENESGSEDSSIAISQYEFDVEIDEMDWFYDNIYALRVSDENEESDVSNYYIMDIVTNKILIVFPEVVSL